jgi:drug/metabolite transporter (DMT)-like permease
VLIDTFRPAGERPGLAAVVGILIGFVGVVLLIGAAAGGTDAANLPGAAALLFASLSWATGSIYGKSARLPASQLLGTGMQMLAGGVALMLLAIVRGEWSGFEMAAVSPRSALALAYLTVIGSSAFVAYVWLLRVAPIPLVATYAYVNPLVAVLLGYFLAQESMTVHTLLAAGLIIGSVVLVSTPRRR